ncbi:MAG TPA: S16 family serine protease [archaeon]|nr:S16 family serine protease [archaeon]
MKIRILFLIIGIAVGAYLGGFLTSQRVSTQYAYCVQSEQPAGMGSVISFATIEMPAVDQNGNGVTTSLDVEVVSGSGKTLTNVDKLFFWTDTQNSIRTAKSVAEQITGKNLNEVDLIYTINANATVIEGPSAGAALTIATIAAIENKSINPDVMITGTINEDGSIGQVGAVLEKAEAAKEIGATLFLVPARQSVQTVYSPERYCRKIGLTQICSFEDTAQTINVSERAGIEVREVTNIGEALQYFLV